MKRRLTSLLICTALLFGTSACGTADDANETSTAPAALSGANTLSADYTSSIFDTSYVHEINVEISQEDWADLLANPTDKTKYTADVTIDGILVSDVSFATKGNTSLSQVAMTDSDRYSFKINFGKFVDGQTYDGLDKLNLNNIFSDSTYLKDYISYRIMAEAGVASPLVSFVSLSINGELFGLYIAIEEIGDSFLERNYGEDSGELYKPETGQLVNMVEGGIDFPDMDDGAMTGNGEWTMPSDGEMPDAQRTFPDSPQDGQQLPPWDNDTEAIPEQWGDAAGWPGNGGMGNNMGSSSSGADLVYTDDEIASYSDIFDNAETAADEEDMQRVIASLKQLSTGEDLDTVIDIEAVLKYFVAHNFVLNFDSYTGTMLHNYYLYEEDGVLSLLPWDYNLAFGGFNATYDSTEAVNWPIDSPLDTGVAEDERPIWTQLIANSDYLELYHEYFDQLLSGYFESGQFEEEIDAVYELIRPYVESDPTAFYTVQEFDTAVETLKQFCLLRTESIRGQLDGSIPSTSEGQAADASSLIIADDIVMNSMGSMNTIRANNGDRNQGFQMPQDDGSSDEQFAAPSDMPQGMPSTEP